MRRLFIDILFFALFLVGLILFFETLYKDHMSRIEKTLERLDENSQNIETLIIGASHTLDIGINKEFKNKNIYNVSIGGQDLLHSYLILKKFLEETTNLSSVIIELEYHSLGYNFSEFNQGWKNRQYFTYTKHLYDKSTINLFLANSSFFNSNRDLNHLLNKLMKSKVKKKQNSKIREQALANHNTPLAPPSENEVAACKKRATEHSRTKYKNTLVGENIEVLRNIISLCETQKINLYFINTPKKKCYLNQYLASKNMLKNKKTLNRIINNSNASYYDFLESKSFDHSDYSNPDHLNEEGLNKLSNILFSKH